MHTLIPVLEIPLSESESSSANFKVRENDIIPEPY